MNRKAFVGPLGDDIPSIFPIIAGVLLFLSTIFYASTIIDERNSYLATRKASLDLSYLLTERGFVSPESFVELCDSRLKILGSSLGVKFISVLDVEKDNCLGLLFTTNADAFYSTQYDDGYGVAGGTKVMHRSGYCTNLDPGLFPLSPDEIAKISSREPVVLNYPVSTLCYDSSTKGIGMITVIAWR